MIVSAHQSSFLPWLPYWHKVLHADIHVVLEGVDFDFQGHQSRVKGTSGWITLPVNRKTKDGPLFDVDFNTAALPKVIRSIEQTYGAKKNPYRYRVEPVLSALKTNSSSKLVDLNARLQRVIMAQLGGRLGRLEYSRFRSSESTKTLRLVDTLANADTPIEFDYLTGSGSSYLDPLELPGSVGLLAQIIPGKEPDQTILSVLVNEPDPQDYVMSRCSYVRMK